MFKMWGFKSWVKMEIRTRRISKTMLELKVTSWGTEITEDITDLNGLVDENFIQSLREVADELEDQNLSMKGE